MSKENSRERIIQLVFGSYPEAKEFHFTSDNQAFASEADANNHAKGLKDKEVESIKRSDVSKASGKVDSKDADKGGKTSEASVTEKAEADKLRADLVEEYTILIGKKPAHNAGVAKLQEAIDKMKAQIASEGAGETKHIITQEDLDANPELVEQGAKVGDEVGLPEE